MTPQEWHAQFNGTLEALVLACASMIATHPEKQKVLALLTALSGRAGGEPTDSPEDRNFKIGIQNAVATIASSVRNAEVADEVLSLKKQSGTH